MKWTDISEVHTASIIRAIIALMMEAVNTSEMYNPTKGTYSLYIIIFWGFSLLSKNKSTLIKSPVCLPLITFKQLGRF
jgi:hypothetical protein